MIRFKYEKDNKYFDSEEEAAVCGFQSARKYSVEELRSKFYYDRNGEFPDWRDYVKFCDVSIKDAIMFASEQYDLEEYAYVDSEVVEAVAEEARVERIVSEAGSKLVECEEKMSSFFPTGKLWLDGQDRRSYLYLESDGTCVCRYDVMNALRTSISESVTDLASLRYIALGGEGSKRIYLHKYYYSPSCQKFPEYVKSVISDEKVSSVSFVNGCYRFSCESSVHLIPYADFWSGLKVFVKQVRSDSVKTLSRDRLQFLSERRLLTGKGGVENTCLSVLHPVSVLKDYERFSSYGFLPSVYIVSLPRRGLDVVMDDVVNSHCSWAVSVVRRAFYASLVQNGCSHEEVDRLYSVVTCNVNMAYAHIRRLKDSSVVVQVTDDFIDECVRNEWFMVARHLTSDLLVRSDISSVMSYSWGFVSYAVCPVLEESLNQFVARNYGRSGTLCSRNYSEIALSTDSCNEDGVYVDFPLCTTLSDECERISRIRPIFTDTNMYIRNDFDYSGMLPVVRMVAVQGEVSNFFRAPHDVLDDFFRKYLSGFLVQSSYLAFSCNSLYANTYYYKEIVYSDYLYSLDSLESLASALMIKCVSDWDIELRISSSFASAESYMDVLFSCSWYDRHVCFCVIEPPDYISGVSLALTFANLLFT